MKSIDALLLKEMIQAGYANLVANKSYVDKLNVFPVPDGDTGTNMSLTMKSAIEKLETIDEVNMENIALAITKGSLMGARGNSGVILSQIFRGFGNKISDKKELTVKDLAEAFDEARKVSYKAVIKPVEGTILTVIRISANFATKNHKSYKDIVNFLEDIVKEGDKALQDTPNQLKELKDAGVVDSGGQGLMFVLEGMLKKLKGEFVEDIPKTAKTENNSKIFDNDIHILDKEPEFGYCTEFILHSDKITGEELKEKIIDMGNSMVVVEGDGMVKVHIHSNEPGKVLGIAGSYGNLDRIKIDNMRLEYQERLAQNKEARGDLDLASNITKIDKKFGIISVSTGDGIANIMNDFGVDYIIKGGQTMNPSTNDFIEAIDSIDKDDIMIFPNNSNIIMAANQAKSMSNKNVVVIPTKNIPQCFQGLIAVDSFGTLKENEKNVMNSYLNVKSGQVTYAVRDTKTKEFAIKKGDYIGLDEKNILSCAKTVDIATMDLIDKMVDEETEIISLYSGEDTTKEDAEKLTEKLQEKYEEYEIELYYGGQVVYNYLISVE